MFFLIDINGNSWYYSFIDSTTVLSRKYLSYSIKGAKWLNSKTWRLVTEVTFQPLHFTDRMASSVQGTALVVYLNLTLKSDA
jgi:hypothetical protein